MNIRQEEIFERADRPLFRRLKRECKDWKLYIKAKLNTEKSQAYLKWSALTAVLCLLVLAGFMTGLQWA